MNYSSIEELVADIKGNPLESNGDIYHPIPFPEFSGLKVASSTTQVLKKWELIQSAATLALNGKIKDSTVLDIGANGGFYSFSFAALGAKVVSFEANPRYAAIGRFLSRDRAPSVNWHSCPFDPVELPDRVIDLTLMLSVFQWMADGGKRLGEASQHLRKISDASRYLIFELGYNRGNSCLKTRRLNHYAALIDFLKANTSYTHFKLMGKTRLWRLNVRYLVLCSNDQRFEDSGLRSLIRRS